MAHQLAKKPINNGIAEHEQKGVTIPKLAANTLANPSLFPNKNARVRCGVKYEFIMPITNTMPVSNNKTLGVS